MDITGTGRTILTMATVHGGTGAGHTTHGTGARPGHGDMTRTGMEAGAIRIGLGALRVRLTTITTPVMGLARHGVRHPPVHTVPMEQHLPAALMDAAPGLHTADIRPRAVAAECPGQAIWDADAAIVRQLCPPLRLAPEVILLRLMAPVTMEAAARARRHPGIIPAAVRVDVMATAHRLPKAGATVIRLLEARHLRAAVAHIAAVAVEVRTAVALMGVAAVAEEAEAVDADDGMSLPILTVINLHNNTQLIHFL